MKKIYSLTVLFFTFFSVSFAQNNATYVNQEALDRSGGTMLLGRTTLSALYRMPYQSWFEKGQKDYEADSLIINKLKPFAKDLTFKIYAATWCGDTRRELPRFIKILADLGVRPSQYELYMVDNHAENYKQAPESTIYGGSIFRVPTFVIEKDGKELDRIIEEPVENLEKDLLSIASGNAYEPAYRLAPRLQNLVRQKGNFYVIENISKVSAEVQDFKTKASELNSYAYALLAQNKPELSLAILRINGLLFPEEGSVYDYMADVYLKNGNTKQALASYKKMLELEPDSEYAKSMVEKYSNQ